MGLLYISQVYVLPFISYTQPDGGFYHKPNRVHVADLQTFKYTLLLDNKRIVLR